MGLGPGAWGKFGYPDDACETPDSLQTICEFEGFLVPEYREPWKLPEI